MSTQIRNPTSDDVVTGPVSGSEGTRYTLVDDHPDSTDYLTFGASACALTFGFPVFTVPAGATGISVQVIYYDVEPVSGTNSNAGRLKVGGNYYNSSIHNPGTNWTLRTKDWTVNPKTSAAWTVDDVNGVGANALEAFGVNSADSNPVWRMFSIILQVTYTAPTPLSVTTQAATAITADSATGNGTIVTIGAGNADLRGVVYSTASHAAPGNVAPAASGYEGVSGETGSFGVGAFTESLTVLNDGVIYYARAYAHDADGYVYGDEINFTTLPIILPDVYMETLLTPLTDSGTDGELVSASNPIDGGLFDTFAEEEGRVIKLAARQAVGSVEGCVVQPVGTNSARWALSLDGSSWEAYGDPLTLGTVGIINIVFYAKAKGTTSETYGVDSTVDLKISAGAETDTFDTKRTVVPHVSIQGAGPYYPGIDFGGGDVWKHNGAGTGGLDITESDLATPAAYSNITFTSASTTSGTTTFTKNLRAGLDIELRVVRLSAGRYRYELDLLPTETRYFKFSHRVTGSNTDNASSVSAYKSAVTMTADSEVFIATALHHITNNVAVSLIPGNGYDNDWCLFRINYASETDWYNTEVASRTATEVKLTYGKLLSDSAADFTLPVPANTTKTYSWVVALDVPASIDDVRAVFYSAYFDAFQNKPLASELDKLFWSTAHQLIRTKRHDPDHAEDKWLWWMPSHFYSPDLYADGYVEAMGIGDLTKANLLLDSFINCGTNDPPGNPVPSAGNSMDGTNPQYFPNFILYCKRYLGYVVPSAYITLLTAQADLIAASIGKMMPTWAGVWGADIGGFEWDLVYNQRGTDMTLWTNLSAGGTISIVGADAGNVPYSGAKQLKMVNAGGGTYCLVQSLPVYCPGSKELVLEQRVNITSSFGSDGVALVCWQYDASNNLLATEQGAYLTTTAGQQLQTHTFTTHADTKYIRLGAVAYPNAGTAYIDNINCTMTSPDSPGLMWSISGGPGYPDSSKWDTVAPYIADTGAALLAMLSYKELIGANWTQTHQDACDDLRTAFTGAFWTDANHNKFKCCLYHKTRELWTNIYGFVNVPYYWFVLSGEKLFTDQEISNIYANMPGKDAIGMPYGANAFRGMVCKLDGNFCEEAEFLGQQQGTYQNGGSWLIADIMLHKLAYWAGVEDAELNYQKRLAMEVYAEYVSHEWLDTTNADGTYQSCIEDNWGYGWNAQVVSAQFILGFSNITSAGCDLDWSEYPGADFVNYKVCRSTQSPVLAADAIATITDQVTLVLTDDTAASDTPYFYAVFVTKYDDSTIKSNEVFLATAEGAAGSRSQIGGKSEVFGSRSQIGGKSEVFGG
jgi:hypothetical protein